MGKKRFIYPAIFLMIVLMLFIIPISAFLAAEIAGVEAARSIWRWVYTFLKDHGSLFAGILGFGGVFILVWSQNKSTQRTVDVTLKAVRTELSEARNRACDEYVLDIIDAIDNIDLIMKGNPRSYANSFEFADVAQKKAKRLKVLSGKGAFEVENIVIESYLNFYKRLLSVYGRAFLYKDAKEALAELSTDSESIGSYLKCHKDLFGEAWYPFAVKELLCPIEMIPSGELVSGEHVYQLLDSDLTRFYYLLNGIKIQLEHMLSCRYSKT